MATTQSVSAVLYDVAVMNPESNGFDDPAISVMEVYVPSLDLGFNSIEGVVRKCREGVADNKKLVFVSKEFVEELQALDKTDGLHQWLSKRLCDNMPK